MTFVDGRQHDFWRVDEARLRRARSAADRPLSAGPPPRVGHLTCASRASALSLFSRSQTPTVICAAATCSRVSPSPRIACGWREDAVTARTSTDSARDIPEATVARLPVYLRALTTPRRARHRAPAPARSSPAAAGVNSAKLRKDLSYLGSYGTRGVGYDVEYLRYQIAREIGVTQDWPVVIVGIGNLGHALANYSGFRSRGFRVVALLDADPDRHDEVVAGVDVRPFDDLERDRRASTASPSA